MLIFLAYIYRYGGVGTAIMYYQHGGTVKIYRADEDEKSVSFGDKSFSKVVLAKDEQGEPQKDEQGEFIPEKDPKGKYQTAAEPAVMWRRFKPYRVFYCQEGFPTVLPWSRDAPITDVTASDINALSRGAFAQGLAKHLLKSADVSLWLWFFAFLFGLTVGIIVFPFIFG